ncbi:glycosyltransferase family 1 protein [Leptospira fletcheri]|uniref:Glycosyltransferase family 1 protein n=1 Tax=Leptospira fletcheri TaxID=2484981 RepID=A0A4R9GG63_9LEPT|nr:glycosyltransferase family 1 protein [Leptospira fletcheri]TGK11660.1 glycosyltransferase family 1 protein [Leptospira fletcheri]
MESPSLKIGYDARMIAHSGIGMRIRGILSELPEIAGKHGIEITVLGSREKLEASGLDPSILSFYKFIHYDAPIYSLLEMWGISEMQEFDILDIPHFNVPLRYLEKCIVTIHDIIPFRLKQFHSSPIKQIYMRLIFSLLRSGAARIITVSDFTAKDLEEVFGFSRSIMRTVYNGIDFDLFHPNPAKEIQAFRRKYGLEQNYLLSVGIGKEHKNLGFVLNVLKSLWSLGKTERQWVIAGADGKLPEYLKTDASGWEDRIRILPRLEPEELGALYSSAGLLLFPSLYEGFGFPPLEAQACGCPVFSSDSSAMPEILGKSAFYFSPTDRDGFESGLLELLQKPKIAVSKKRLATSNVKKYDWKISAKKTVEEYLLLAKKRKLL